MGFLSRMREKAQGMAAKRPEQVNKGIDTAAKKVDEKTGGRYSEKIDQGTQKAKEQLGQQGQEQQGQQGQQGEQSPQGQQGEQSPQGQQGEQGGGRGEQRSGGA